jgi:hypothetical protein
VAWPQAVSDATQKSEPEREPKQRRAYQTDGPAGPLANEADDDWPPLEPPTEPPGKAGPLVVCDGVRILAAKRVDAHADEDEHRRQRCDPGDSAVKHEQSEDRERCAERESDPCTTTLCPHIATLHTCRAVDKDGDQQDERARVAQWVPRSAWRGRTLLPSMHRTRGDAPTGALLPFAWEQGRTRGAGPALILVPRNSSAGDSRMRTASRPRAPLASDD